MLLIITLILPLKFGETEMIILNEKTLNILLAFFPNAEVAANDYNIAVSSYVEQEDTREIVDIRKLNAEITEIVKREDELRKAIDEIVESLEI